MLPPLRLYCAILLAATLLGGCSLVPDVRTAPQFHNPFPQLSRVAILPFFNQSSEPTLDQSQVAAAYYAQLQAIPGFEVLPNGVTQLMWQRFVTTHGEPTSGEGFQEFAKFLDVDAVVVGSVTDYTPYYPPRIAITTHWYASNPGFHPIPPGYGLPWGTAAEKEIHPDIVLNTEFELARQQLATQTPQTGAEDGPEGASPAIDSLPAEWPDPSGLIPDPPSPIPPVAIAQSAPVLSHTRIYHGDDASFTQKLADHYYQQDDARFGGWQSYLSRSDDFIRFCCKLHITEMLESRGGKHKSDLIIRWPISRYWR